MSWFVLELSHELLYKILLYTRILKDVKITLFNNPSNQQSLNGPATILIVSNIDFIQDFSVASGIRSLELGESFGLYEIFEIELK